jgi:hypothetical protein
MGQQVQLLVTTTGTTKTLSTMIPCQAFRIITKSLKNRTLPIYNSHIIKSIID